MEEALEPACPRRGALLVLVQVVVALGATLGYLIAIVPEYGYAPAWPLNVGCAILLGLLWWLAVRGGRGMTKPGMALGLIGFGCMIAGHVLLTRAEAELRAELNRSRYERLASEPDKYFNEEDALGKELENVFGPSVYENRSGWKEFPSTFNPLEPKQDAYEAMARRVEERKPGWPRILHAFWRTGHVQFTRQEGDEKYHGHIRTACGHYLGRMGTYGVLQILLRTERRAMQSAEADRETFLKAWKNRPVER